MSALSVCPSDEARQHLRVTWCLNVPRIDTQSVWLPSSLEMARVCLAMVRSQHVTHLKVCHYFGHKSEARHISPVFTPSQDLPAHSSYHNIKLTPHHLLAIYLLQWSILSTTSPRCPSSKLFISVIYALNAPGARSTLIAKSRPSSKHVPSGKAKTG